MRTAWIVLASCALLVAACSSGGPDPTGNATVPVTPVDTAAPPTEPTATDAAAVFSAPPAPAESQDTAPADTAVVDRTEAAESGQDGTDSEDPLVIDGPAAVRPSCATLARGATDFTLDAGGGLHDVRIYVPEQISSDPAPTVVNWHGLGSNGPDQAAFTGYEELADREGFIVVHPTGLDFTGSGQNSWELTQFDSPQRDDLAFADALIDTVVADWCADPDRIYSTGMSNGGFFTSELVCNRSDRIAAAVSVAGTSHAESCDPERSVPYVSFHGTADDVVPYGGGDSVLADDSNAGGFQVEGFFDQVMPVEFAEFAADAGCDPAPTRVDETVQVVRYDYTGCEDDTPMTFYEIVGGGHTWPSSPLSDLLADFGLFTQDVDATADGWAFMSQFSL